MEWSYILDTLGIISVTDDLFSCVAGLASNDHMIRSLLLLSPPLALTAPIPLIARRFPTLLTTSNPVMWYWEMALGQGCC